jgi:hypothetical protein
LENIATQMTVEAEILVPAKNGGRPRKLDAKVAAERMRYAARILSVMEITCEPLLLALDGVAQVPPLDTLVKLLDNIVAITPVRVGSAATAYLGVFEIIDALTDVGLLQDRQFRARPGGAARAVVAIAWWTAPATVGTSVDLEKLLQEYTDREPRPPALAKPARSSKLAPNWRHIEDVRRVSWRTPNRHGSEPGNVRSGISERSSMFMVHAREDLHADPAAAAGFHSVAP